MSRKVFIVEDHPVMREMVVAFLEDLPAYSLCGVADTAEEALERIAEVEPDLALVDVSLPGMSGIELVEEVQARWPRLPCLMLSGHGEASYVERSLAAGAGAYILKGKP